MSKAKNPSINALKIKNVGSVAEGFSGIAGKEGVVYLAAGWQVNTVYGGGEYVFDPDASKSLHDGGKYISSSVPGVSSQAGASFQEKRDAYISATGETDAAGTGVFVAVGEMNESRYGAVGGGAVDDSIPLQGYFSSTNRIRTESKAYLVAQPITKIADDIECQFGGTKFINGGPGFLMTFGERSDTPIYEGLTVSGGRFEQQDAATTQNRNFICVKGTADIEIKTRCKNISNGGITIEAGCEDGSVEAKIRGKTGYSPARAIWLNGATASDFADQLVDTVTLTRNATPLPVYAVKRISVKADIKMDGYGVYAINTRECSITGSNIDISGAGASRCVAINNYSPDFTVTDNTLTSDRSSTGVLVTQASDGVLIENNRFKGDFGGNRDVLVQYLAEASILGNKFLTNTVKQIQVDMGGSVNVEGNYSKSPGGYQADHRFVSIATLDPAIAGTGTFGDQATVLAGSVVKGNTIKAARIPCVVEAQTSAGGRTAGIESIVVKNNTLKDWDQQTTASERGLLVISPDDTYAINYTYYDNDVFPAEKASLNLVKEVGAGASEVRTDAQMAVVRVSVSGGSVSSAKRYGGNFSCGGSLSGNDLILSPRTIGGAAGAGIGSVFAIVDAGGTVAAYDISVSGSNYQVTLKDGSGADIALSTTDATVDVVVSAKAS